MERATIFNEFHYFYGYFTVRKLLTFPWPGLKDASLPEESGLDQHQGADGWGCVSWGYPQRAAGMVYLCLFHGKSHKWMMTGATPMTKRKPRCRFDVDLMDRKGN